LGTNNKKIKHKLFIGDALNVLKNNNYVEEESVTLAVTSPPYGLGKDYGEGYKDKYDLDTWLDFMNKAAKEVFRVLKPNGSYFLNVSPIPHPKTKEIIPLDSYVFLELKKAGFKLRNKVIWHFNNMQNPIKRLSGRWEAVLWFVKDIENYVFNLEDIRIPYITKGDKRLTGSGRNPTDVWYFDRVNNMTKNKFNINHPCVYPEPMIERILKMSSNKDDLILDPFVGSGTTMKVAKYLERRSIGIEINEKYEELIKRRFGEDTHLSFNYQKEIIEEKTLSNKQHVLDIIRLE